MRCLVVLLLVLFILAYGWLWVWPKVLAYFIIDPLPLPVDFDLAHDMSRV